MHVHVLDVARNTDRTRDNEEPPALRPTFYTRIFLRRLGFSLAYINQVDANQRLIARFNSWIDTCNGIDRFVILALDRAYDDDGNAVFESKAPVVSNRFVADLVKTNPSLLFGASIHPYRADALSELDEVVSRGACLVKWIPSTHRIRLDDARCIAFYERLAELRLPLLVHTGNEHGSGWSWSRNHWNSPALLRHPLRRGVKVIAAHCGARLFLHERSYFKEFCRMAREYEHLYGDISAFGIPTRITALRRLLSTPDLLAKILYGSDFPAFVMPRWFAPWIGTAATRRMLAQSNPLEQPYRLMRAMGVPDEVFERAGKVLRLSSN